MACQLRLCMAPWLGPSNGQKPYSKCWQPDSERSPEDKPSWLFFLTGGSSSQAGGCVPFFFNTGQASDHTFALQPSMRTFFPSQPFSLSSIGAFKVNQPLSAARPHPGRELGLDLWLQFNSSVKCLAISLFFFFKAENVHLQEVAKRHKLFKMGIYFTLLRGNGWCVKVVTWDLVKFLHKWLQKLIASAN